MQGERFAIPQQETNMVRVSSKLESVMEGYSIEELRQLLEMRDEIQAIANGPDPDHARAWLECRHCVARLRKVKSYLGRD